MTRRAAILCAALLAAAAARAGAQTQSVSAALPPCPRVTISEPGSVTAGGPLAFTAEVSGGDPNVKPVYRWTLSAGTITGGQGTASITVATTGVGNSVMTALVEVEGYGSGCVVAECQAVAITSPIVCRRAVDEYGNIEMEDEMARLDNFSIALQSEPGARGFIHVYGGRRGRAGEASARGERAKRYLVEVRGIPDDRVVVIDGGHKQELTLTLWVVPDGVEPPTTSPTVDPSEVEIIPDPEPRRAQKARARSRGQIL